MGGRGASAGDTNSRILSKIVSLENKRNGENTRQYLRDNNLSLMQDYENVQRTENITYRTLQGKDETYTETINEKKKEQEENADYYFNEAEKIIKENDSHIPHLD